MSSRLSPEFVAAFTELINQEMSISANEFYQKGMAILKEHKLLRYVVKQLPKFFLTHKENRNRLMLNARNVHVKGAVIYAIGADLQQLSTAVCVELAPDGPSRIANIEANKSLVSKSQGLLAPVNGEELFLTLGCGHTVAFCKAAACECLTTSSTIADSLGRVDYAKLAKQPHFKTMMDEGWDWVVIPFQVDGLFPRFAQVVQRALNGGNSASTEIGELETAMTLSDLQAQLDGKEGWEEIAVASVKGGSMSCANYVETLMEFVKSFGGGPGAPHITFMDNIGKSYNSKMTLGEEFWHAITFTIFSHDKLCFYPLTRVALALANLTTDKQTDGIARCIVKSDVVKLASKGCSDKAKRVELTLQQGFHLVESLGLSQEAVKKQLGVFFVRVGLCAVDKGKIGPEAKDHCIEDIQKMFLIALSVVVGKKINFPAWDATSDSTPTATATAAAAAPTTASSAPVALKDYNSATWLLDRKGFKLGVAVKKKTADASSIFKITSIDDETNSVKLIQLVRYDAHVPLECTAPVLEILEDWHVSNNPGMPVKLSQGETRLAGLSISLQVAKIYTALLQADFSAVDEHNKSLVFWTKPASVFSGESLVNKGKLILTPVMPMLNIGVREVHNGVSFGKIDGTAFFGSGPVKPPTPEDVEKASMVAYWWVEKTANEDEANMKEDIIKVDGIPITRLKNTCALKPWTKLFKFVPAVTLTKDPLRGAPKNNNYAKGKDRKRKSD